MPLTNNYPNILPSLLLDFARAQILDPRITFTRASTATRVNEDGLVETVASGVARFEFDPITLESRGLLIEEQRTNLLTYSNNFSNGIWTPVNAFPTRTQNLTGPDGISNSAWTLDDQYTGSDGAAIEQTVSLTPSASTQYTCSFWAKQDTAALFDFLIFFTGVSVKGSGIRYVWATNTLSAFAADGGGITPTVFGRVQYPNGWSRFYVVVSDANSGLNTALQFRIYPAGREAGGVTGTMGWYGAQCEIGANPTSYISTTAVTVTRDADTASIQSIQSFFNYFEGTLYFKVAAVAQTGVSVVQYPAIGFTPADLSSSKTIQVFKASNINTWYYLVRTNTGDVVNITYSNAALSTANIAIAYKANDFAASLNGAVANTDTSGDLPTSSEITALCIGSFNSTGRINSTISKIAYYPVRLTNAQLQALTG